MPAREKFITMAARSTPMAMLQKNQRFRRLWISSNPAASTTTEVIASRSAV
jgi:hypothetical protein